MKLSCLITPLLVGATLGQIQVTSAGDAILPTYLKEQKVNEFSYKKRTVNMTDNLILQCNFTTTAPTSLHVHSWTFKSKSVNDGGKYKLRKVIEGNRTTLSLIISNPGVNQVGEYECSINLGPGKNVKEKVNLFSAPVIEVEKKDMSLRQKQGNAYKMVCDATYHPKNDTTFHWFKDDHTKPWTRRAGIIIEDEIDSAGKKVAKGNVLKFDELKVDDRGVYFCRVKSKTYGEDTMGWYLRVLDPMAPIWPLIGIIIEVILVIIIIVIYEVQTRKRRRAKKQADLDLQLPAAGSEEQTLRVDRSGGETRQRPVRV